MDRTDFLTRLRGTFGSRVRAITNDDGPDFVGSWTIPEDETPGMMRLLLWPDDNVSHAIEFKPENVLMKATQWTLSSTDGTGWTIRKA